LPHVQIPFTSNQIIKREPRRLVITSFGYQPSLIIVIADDFSPRSPSLVYDEVCQTPFRIAIGAPGDSFCTMDAIRAENRPETRWNPIAATLQDEEAGCDLRVDEHDG